MANTLSRIAANVQDLCKSHLRHWGDRSYVVIADEVSRRLATILVLAAVLDVLSMNLTVLESPLCLFELFAHISGHCKYESVAMTPDVHGNVVGNAMIQQFVPPYTTEHAIHGTQRMLDESIDAVKGVIIDMLSTMTYVPEHVRSAISGDRDMLRSQLGLIEQISSKIEKTRTEPCSERSTQQCCVLQALLTSAHWPKIQTRSTVALKGIPGGKQCSQIHREINVLQELSEIPVHANILLPLAVSHQAEKIAFEYVPSDLYDLITTHTLDVFQVVNIFRQTSTVLVHLHQHGFAHRDVKPENMLVRDDGHVLVTDFEMAVRVPVNVALTSHAVGTPWFMHPRALGLYVEDGNLMRNPYPNFQVPPETVFSADVYALGLSFCIAITEKPFSRMRPQEPDQWQRTKCRHGKQNPCWPCCFYQSLPKLRASFHILKFDKVAQRHQSTLEKCFPCVENFVLSMLNVGEPPSSLPASDVLDFFCNVQQQIAFK